MAETTTNRVAVDVIDRGMHDLIRCDVAVVAAAFLPESSMPAFPAVHELLAWPEAAGRLQEGAV